MVPFTLLMNRSLSDFDSVLLKTRREVFPSLLGKIFLTKFETSNRTLLDTVHMYCTVQIILPHLLLITR